MTCISFVHVRQNEISRNHACDLISRWQLWSSEVKERNHSSDLGGVALKKWCFTPYFCYCIALVRGNEVRSKAPDLDCWNEVNEVIKKLKTPRLEVFSIPFFSADFSARTFRSTYRLFPIRIFHIKDSVSLKGTLLLMYTHCTHFSTYHVQLFSVDDYALLYPSYVSIIVNWRYVIA